MCLVPAIDGKVIVTVMKTWGKECDVIRFFVDRSDKLLKQNPLVVDFPSTYSCQTQTCDNQFGKTFFMWKWAYNSNHSVNWYFKVDSDTYVFVANAKRYLRRYSANEKHYMGHVGFNEFNPYASGGLYILSQTALNYVYPLLGTIACPNVQGERREDVLFGTCMINAGIPAKNIWDKYGRETIMQLSLNDHFTLDPDSPTRVNSWYVDSNMQIHWKTDCCSYAPISFHQVKNLNELINIHQKVHNNIPINTPAIVGQYLEKVHIQTQMNRYMP